MCKIFNLYKNIYLKLYIVMDIVDIDKNLSEVS